MARIPPEAITDSRIMRFAERMGESGIARVTDATGLAEIAWGAAFTRVDPAQRELFQKHFDYGRNRARIGAMLKRDYPKGPDWRELGVALRTTAPGRLWDADIPPSRLFAIIRRMWGSSLDSGERSQLGIGYYSEYVPSDSEKSPSRAHSP